MHLHNVHDVGLDEVGPIIAACAIASSNFRL